MTENKRLAGIAVLVSFLIFSGATVSCRDGNSDNGNAMARQLFSKSVNLIKAYTDSIRNVSDSSSFQRMTRGFEDRIVKINFQFPPDTDLRMTQEENDSLINMLDSLVSIIRMKENALGRAIVTDSLRNDSLSENIPVAVRRHEEPSQKSVRTDSVVQ